MSQQKITIVKMIHRLFIMTLLALLLSLSACGQLRGGVTPTEMAEKPTATTDASQADSSEKPDAVITVMVTPLAPSAEPTAQADTRAVIAWRGSIHSLPPEGQFDDYVALQPGGTQQLGLQGATPELEAQISELRDAGPPDDSVLMWGEWACEVDDYNGCRITVERLQHGPVHTSGEQVEGWVGTITSSTFNQGASYVFVLSGDYPMWYSLHASQKPELQAEIERLRDTGALVQVWGELLTGVPDVNGTRIEAGVLGVLQEGKLTPAPLPESVLDPNENWLTYINERYNYQFKYPPQAELDFFGPQVFPTDELPAGMTSDEYMAYLLEQYTDQLCVSIYYSLGYIYISAPENLPGKYSPCGRTGVGQAEIVEKSEALVIDGQNYQVRGMEIIGQDDTLVYHNETYYVVLEDGTRIEFGAVPNAEASYQDYLMKTRQTLLRILESYQSLD